LSIAVKIFVSLGLSAATLLAAAPAHAADARFSPKPMVDRCDDDDSAPTDAFGFTDGAGIAARGGGSAGLTVAGDTGVRRGRSMGRGAVLQGAYGILPCMELSASLSGGTARSLIDREGLKDKSYGGSVELKYRLLSHGRNGMGLTVGIDNGIERNESHGLGRFTTYGTTLKLMADKILIPDILYGALNVSHNFNWSGPSPYQRGSHLTLGASLAWQVMEDFYLSGEVRHMRQQGTLGFGRREGHATYVGPGIYWQATEQLAVSVAYNLQVYGKETGEPGRLDLTNFSRHLFQLDVGWTF
jgi:hypothetical protein